MSGKKRILLIEGDESQRKLILQLLAEDNTYNVVPVKSGVMAMHHLGNAEVTPDLILTEFKVAGGGISLLKSFAGIGIPVIVLTGSPEDAIEEMKKAKLKFPVVAKPVDFYKLLASIDSLTLTDISNTVHRQEEIWD